MKTSLIAIFLLLFGHCLLAQCESSLSVDVDPLTKKVLFSSGPLTYVDSTINNYSAHLMVGGSDGEILITLIVESDFDLICLNQYNERAYIIGGKKDYPLIHIGRTNCEGAFVAKITDRTLGKIQYEPITGIKITSNDRTWSFILSEDQRDSLMCSLNTIAKKFENY